MARLSHCSDSRLPLCGLHSGGRGFGPCRAPRLKIDQSLSIVNVAGENPQTHKTKPPGRKKSELLRPRPVGSTRSRSSCIQNDAWRLEMENSRYRWVIVAAGGLVGLGGVGRHVSFAG